MSLRAPTRPLPLHRHHQLGDRRPVRLLATDDDDAWVIPPVRAQA